ncbi:MAG: TRAM domain-containing protein, partial [Nitrospinae bacterium]|nr:TRAM domain-containing protein [Nitrospinota bacterium]
TAEQGQSYIGKNIEVLIEGRSSKQGYSFKGRSPQYWGSNIRTKVGTLKTGDIIKVNVENVTGHSLNGTAIL